MNIIADIKRSYGVTKDYRIWLENIQNQGNLDIAHIGLPKSFLEEDRLYALISSSVLIDDVLYKMREYKSCSREDALTMARGAYILHSIFALFPIDGSTEYWVRGYWND